MIRNFEELLKCAATMTAKSVVVINPKDVETFSAISDARDEFACQVHSRW